MSEEFRAWLRGRIAGDRRSNREWAEEIGVAHTTFNNWLKGTDPSFPHCKLVADFFEVRPGTIRRMAGYEDETTGAVSVAASSLTPEEEALVLAYRAASPTAQRTLLGVARVVSENAAATDEQAPVGLRPRRAAPGPS